MSDKTTALRFPEDFLWGAATSSFQVEGSWDAHGKGESIWDRFARLPGKIADGSHGETACNHYVIWRDDIELMKKLGLQTYRFSISWPRILPDGRGRINQKGLDFYSELVDELLEAGIAPNATLYHWDLPQVLQDQGGWPTRDIVEAFVEYADIVSRRLGDRVRFWATINEPWVIAKLGYEWGIHAPGHKDRALAVNAAHHLLLAHGSSLPVIRRNSPGASVGIVLNLMHQTPATAHPDDLKATRQFDGDFNRWFLDPLAGFGYPADVLTTYDGFLDTVQPGDMEIIAEPIDFLGINYYTRAVIRADSDDPAPESESVPSPGAEFTEMGWEVYPQGLYDVLMRVHFHYGFPSLYITENGAAFVDIVSEDGRVHDERRVAYLYEHLKQARRAIQAGVALHGYYAWSLLDNFEWTFGYTKRFGLIYVDFDSQERILKDSAFFYQKVIEQNGVQAGLLKD